MDFRQKIESSQNWFEDLVNKIPGYSGYKEKEQRREADTLLRQHLAAEFEAQWHLLNDLKSQMLIGPAMSHLDEVGRAARRLQTLIDKIKSAAQGYAGFFDAVKVKEAELDNLYQFDQAMLARVDEVSDAINAVQTALDNQEGLPQAIRNLLKTIDAGLAHFEKRSEVVTGSF